MRWDSFFDDFGCGAQQHSTCKAKDKSSEVENPPIMIDRKNRARYGYQIKYDDIDTSSITNKYATQDRPNRDSNDWGWRYKSLAIQ